MCIYTNWLSSAKRLSKCNTMVHVQVLVRLASSPYNGFSTYIQLGNAPLFLNKITLIFHFPRSGILVASLDDDCLFCVSRSHWKVIEFLIGDNFL